MGIVDRTSSLRAATRFARSLAKQPQLLAAKKQAPDDPASVQTDAAMLDARRDFLAPADRGFLESIIEQSDLMPLRYLGIGQLAAAVGRIDLGTRHSALGFETPAASPRSTAKPRPPNGPAAPPSPWIRKTMSTGSRSRPGSSVSALGTRRSALNAPRAVDGTSLDRYGYLRLFAVTGNILREEYATIIQHPSGRQKHLASRNNRVTVYVYDGDLNDEEKAANNFLHYSTDTLKGSSGSPAFSDQWFVVALHRRGVPATATRNGKTVILRTNGKPAAADDPNEVIRYTSNEGVRISRVLGRLADIAATGQGDRQSAASRALEAITKAAGSVENGPLSRPTVRVSILDEGRAPGEPIAFEPFELVRRKIDVFPEGLGYNERFLKGHLLPLPKPSASLLHELAPRLDQPGKYLLPFRHFTTAVHARRRVPIFFAVNIDGARKPAGGIPNRPGWSIDPRIDEAHQADDSIFSSMLERGHLAARDYVYWGEDAAEIKQADTHSFTLTNVCPQIRAFNAHKEWYEIERQVADGAEREERRVTEFVGPILRATDPTYDELRSAGSTATAGTGIRIPLKFWKIVAWAEGGEPKHRAFLLDQREELVAAGPLELSLITPAKVKDSTVAEIASLTDLDFDGF